MSVADGEPSARQTTNGPLAALPALLARVHKLLNTGQIEAAALLGRQLLSIAPDHSLVVLMWAEILSALGRQDEAFTSLTALAEKNPDNAVVHFCIGNVHHAAGRLREATTSLQRAIEVDPKFAAAYCNLGLVLESAGECGAVEAYEHALALQPDMAEGHANLARILDSAGRSKEAMSHARQAVALKPGIAKNHLLLGTLLHRAGTYGAAVECCQMAIKLKPDFAEAYGVLGEALVSQEDIIGALPPFQRVVELKPNFAMGWVALGSALGSLGRLRESVGCFEKAITLSPNLEDAHRALANARALLGHTDEIDRLRRFVADTNLSKAARGSAALSLAKLYDDTARYDDAFASAIEGNRILREDQRVHGIVYDHASFCAGNDKIVRAFTREFMAMRTSWGNPSAVPVFVVGAFRTGTTLVEQICASHTDVHGCGELPITPRPWFDLWEAATWADWTPPLIREHADRYLAYLKTQAPKARRIIDKMPNNVFVLGLIALLFPRAHIVICHRDGRDAALSVFFQRFPRRVDYATDLIDTGRRWHEAERMASYWAKTLPLPVHHIQYETLVSDFETEARKLIAFLGLDWQPSCHEFHETKRHVQTASAWQVRQPLYSSAVGRWRHYRKHLGELSAAMGIPIDAPTGFRPTDLD